MALRLTTLGGFRTRRDDVDLEWLPSRRLRAGLLVYLAVERRASRETLAGMFWPENAADNARHALRQCLFHLRRDLGDACVDVRGHELIASDSVHIDVHDFTAALARGAYSAAADLYGGPFLAGVNLLDLRSWESWVEARRLYYARAFRKACRAWVDALEDAGDRRGAIDAAERWTAPDPFDDEAQHRLVQALAAAGERTSAIRQYESYTRLLEAEGLRPLDQTTALIEQIRATPAHGGAPPGTWERDESAGPKAPPWIPDPAPPAPAPAHAAAHPVETHAPAPRRLRLRPLAIGAAALLVIAAGAARVLLVTADPWPSATSSDVAVFPFSVRGGDQYLGDGMVTLLGTALDGATLRPVDGRAVLGVVTQNGGDVPDLASGARLATRLGADMYVLGEVVEAGERMQIEAAVYRTGASGDAIARGSMTGGAEHLFELVDGLAAQLLAGVGAVPDELTRTAAATTTSLAAFKDYLEGEAEVRGGRFERGIDAFRRAIERDSTFAVAHYRLAIARDWAAQAGSGDAARAASRHAARLAPHDRARLQAYSAYIAGEADAAERQYRTILARYPEDVEALLQLAEVLFHYGIARGRSPAETEEAWRKVIAYDHRSLPAIVHLARIAAPDRRVATLDSLLAAFAPEERATDRRLVQVRALRAIAARDSAKLGALMDIARGWEDAAAWQLAAYITAFSSVPADARRALQGLVAPHRSAGLVADLHWFTALLHLENERLAPARQSLARAVAAAPTIPPAYRLAFELVSEWWIAALPMPQPDSALERARRAASSAELPTWSDATTEAGNAPVWFELAREALGPHDRLEALRLFTVGQLSLRLDDAPAAERASAALTRLAMATDADGFVRSLDRELRARRAWHEGDPAEAIRILGDEPPLLVSVGATMVVPFLAHAQQRYLRGELLVALGRDADALPWFASIGRLSAPEVAMRARAHLRQAEIHERLGNRTEAARHRAEFGRLTSDPTS